ncbi:MAG: tetratricopeptide repeat protein [Desulfobacterales bacterium]
MKGKEMKIVRSFLALILVLTLSSCANQITSVMSSKQATVEDLATQCNEGDMDACLKAGRTYRYGHYFIYDAPKDLDLATKYYILGCDGKNQEACKALYEMYKESLRKKEFTRGHPTILDMYGNSCTGGYGPACSSLAYNYEIGKGVDKNQIKALALYEKGCNSGSRVGCDHAGDIYMKGKHVTRDPIKAKQFYEKACGWGYVNSCAELGLMYLKGDTVKKDINKAYTYFVSSCSGHIVDNDTTGCYNLAKMYEKGIGCELNQAQAINLYSQACRWKPKIADACVKLAQAYESGVGIEKDHNAAWNYYRDACELGSPEGCVGWHTDGCDRHKNVLDCEWLKKHDLY